MSSAYPYTAILFVVDPLMSIATKLNLITFYIIIFSIAKSSYFRNQVNSTEVNLNPLFFFIRLDT